MRTLRLISGIKPSLGSAVKGIDDATIEVRLLKEIFKLVGSLIIPKGDAVDIFGLWKLKAAGTEQRLAMRGVNNSLINKRKETLAETFYKMVVQIYRHYPQQYVKDQSYLETV